jgi:succinylarginine dihydrolase
MNAQEANFDGLVGPTHNYAGLSFGNVASLNNENRPRTRRQPRSRGCAR